MTEPTDRLYELLPAVHRQRDAEDGFPLRALLGIITEQMDVLTEDIANLYDDWFIETCRDWVVPYIGELVGYRPVYDAGEPGDVTTAAGRLRNRILYPRADVAHTIANRRRRGSLSVLVTQALDVAGWSARAVELFALLGLFQSPNHVHLDRGRLADLRDGDALDRLGGPLDGLARTADTRTATTSTSIRYNIPNVALFVWRLRAQSVTLRQPYLQEEVGRQFYTFSALGNDTPLFNRAEPPERGAAVADELQAPAPIGRRVLERRLHDFYGEDKSLQIWWVPPDRPTPRGTPPTAVREPIGPDRVVVADLTDWQYRPPDGKVAVDPVLGRIAFPAKTSQLPRRGIWVSYHQGTLADLGGGEYPRALAQPTSETRVYRVGEREQYRRIADALQQWSDDAPRHAFVEIADSAVYTEQVLIELADGQGLELRAANGAAPVIRLLDWQADQPDSISVTGGAGSCFVLDGLLVAGRGIRVTGGLARLAMRHCTLVPGWALRADCTPRRPAEPSLELDNVDAYVTIEHSIVGSIQVGHDEVNRDPIRIDIDDSVLDATAFDREALCAPGWPFAHVALTVRRSTVFGRIEAHAITLGENSILHGRVRVARRQHGCLRFCYVAPGSRTPRRFGCQPDLAFAAVDAEFESGKLTAAERDAARRREELRVEPEYASTRYGTPAYCDLARTSAQEIRRGADDESAMGVFHDLFQPQREANLSGRLRDFVPAGAHAAIIFVT